MVISFDTNEIRLLCERQEKAEELLGKNVALKLRNRLSDIDACDRIFEIPIGHPAKVMVRGEIGYQFDLGNDVYLVISANHNDPVRNSLDDIDWNHVYRVKVIQVGGNYEQLEQF
ncbi:hypothetical protein CBR65_15130 [Cellvibrio sp. PSBB006]|nr:hypothetical protein CBR65_15130 [Cellvibrio sp. PSBB006]